MIVTRDFGKIRLAEKDKPITSLRGGKKLTLEKREEGPFRL